MVSGNLNSVTGSNNFVIGEGNIVKSKNPLISNMVMSDNKGTFISNREIVSNYQREIERPRELELQREI